MKQITQREVKEKITNGEALKFQSRKEIKETVIELLKEGKEISTFTLIDDWYYLKGISWVNAVEFILIEGNYELVD